MRFPLPGARRVTGFENSYRWHAGEITVDQWQIPRPVFKRAVSGSCRAIPVLQPLRGRTCGAEAVDIQRFPLAWISRIGY